MAETSEERIQWIDRQITSLSEAVESLQTKIGEIESFQATGLSVSIVEATKQLLRPVLIRLRATTHKSEEEIDEELLFLLEVAGNDVGEYFKLIMSPSLAAFVLGETDTLLRPRQTLELGELQNRFDSLVRALENRRDSEKSFSNIRIMDLENKLNESLSRLADLQRELEKLNPLKISELEEETLIGLSERLGYSKLSSDSLAEKVLQAIPSNLARDLKNTQLLATAIQSKQEELLLITSVAASGIGSVSGSCSGCLMSNKDCRCQMLQRLTLTLDRLLENTPESSSSLIQKYWLSFYPYFYLNPADAADTIRVGIPDSTMDLTPYLTEVISRLLFGDLLNSHWFKSDIEASQSSSSDRMNLNRWTKSVTGLTIRELGERLGGSVPALSRDEELPIAWLLSVTNGAHEFSDELEIFLQIQVEAPGP